MTGLAETAVADALERIGRENPRINAFADVFHADATARARNLDRDDAPAGPLAGRPFAAKDLFDVAGRPTRAGSSIRADGPPAERDATAIARLKDAGAVLVGLTHMDEFAYGFTGENAHYGAVRNPRDPDRIAGGSSSGSGAAVAAGLVPFALGSDTNGSVRVPAALCGIYGFKPTYGRVSRAGVAQLAWSFDHVGVLAASLEDTAAALDAIQGPDGRDPSASPDEPDALSPHLGAPLDGLRVAVAGGHFATGGFPGVFASVQRVAECLGADRQIEIPDSDRAGPAALLITSAEAATLHLNEIRTRIGDFDRFTRARWAAAAMIPHAWVARAQQFRRRYRDTMWAAFEEIDILIAPTTPFGPTKIGQSQIEIGGETLPVRGTLGRFTAPFSFIGWPAMSVPVPGDGPFPLGVQLVAAPGRDGYLLRAASRLRAEGVAGP